MSSSNGCRAADKTKCPYHGALLRLETAIVNGDIPAYNKARAELAEHAETVEREMFEESFKTGPKKYALRTQVKLEELEVGTSVYRISPEYVSGTVKTLTDDKIHISNGDDDFFIYNTGGFRLTGWFHGNIT